MIIDTRPADTQHAISALRKYLEITEAQIVEVHRCELVALEARRPPNGDEEDMRLFSDEKNGLEELFEQDLTPAMRYSFVVLMHTVFETHLRAFCQEMRQERAIPIALGDVNGSPIEKAQTYLTKLAAIQVGGFPQWQHLRTLQTVRDCIVHAYGYISESKDEGVEIRKLAKQKIGIADNYGRLALTKEFCEQCLVYLDEFFHSLFQAAGWKPCRTKFEQATR
jgi:hypothetical protein